MPQVTDAYGNTFNIDRKDVADFERQVAYEKSLIDGTVFEKYNFDKDSIQDVKNQMAVAQNKAEELGLLPIITLPEVERVAFQPPETDGEFSWTGSDTTTEEPFRREGINYVDYRGEMAPQEVIDALKMSMGAEETDLSYDVNGDGKVDLKDVLAFEKYGSGASLDEDTEDFMKQFYTPKDETIPVETAPPDFYYLPEDTYLQPKEEQPVEEPRPENPLLDLVVPREEDPVEAVPQPVAPRPVQKPSPYVSRPPTPQTDSGSYTPAPYDPSAPTYTTPAQTVPSSTTFDPRYEAGPVQQTISLPTGTTGQSTTVMYRNQRGQQIPITEVDGKPVTYVPPGYTRSGTSQPFNQGGTVGYAKGGDTRLDAEYNLASKFLGYKGPKSRPALNDFMKANPGAAARMGKYQQAMMGMAYGGYTGGPAERGRGAPAPSPAPKPSPRPVPNTPPPSVSSPPPSVSKPTRPRARPEPSSRDRDDRPPQPQQMQQAFQQSTPTTQTKPLQFSEGRSENTQEQRFSSRMKESGAKYTYNDEAGNVIGEGDSKKSIFDLDNPWSEAFKIELDNENKPYEQIGNKIIVPNKTVEDSKNTKFGIYQGKFFIKGQDPIYGNKFEVGLKYDPMSNTTEGSFDYSVPLNVSKVFGMNQGGMVRGFEEGGTTEEVDDTNTEDSGKETPDFGYYEDAVPMFGDVVSQTMQPMQSTISYITPTSDQMVDPSAGQVGTYAPTVGAAQVSGVTQATTPSYTPTATYGATTTAEGVAKETAAMPEVTGEVSPEAQVTAEQGVSSLNIDAAQGTATMMTNPVTREIQEGELISGAADAQKASKFTEQIQAAQATPSKQATVQGQLEGLMQQFEGGQTPAWAAGAMRNALGAMAARGLGASSLAGQAAIQAAMESALPIAQADAQTVASFEAQNLSNRQQRAMLAAQQRAQFMGQEFDQAFQARVQNSSRIADIANMNFTAEQQVALENSRAANTMNLANLSNRQAGIMAEAAAIANMDMANLNNRQQAAVQNAQSFLAMDMSNLDRSQQTAMFRAQQNIQALFTDQAAENAALQFNAANENQTKQFFASLSSQTSQFNAAQANSINQFNVNSVNAVRQFNANLQQQRDTFNATNGLVVAQANAQWRQNIATINNATQNLSNQDFAKTINALTSTNIDAIWQRERDLMQYNYQSVENSKDRAVNILLGDKELEALRLKINTAEGNAKDEMLFSFLFGLPKMFGD